MESNFFFAGLIGEGVLKREYLEESRQELKIILWKWNMKEIL